MSARGASQTVALLGLLFLVVACQMAPTKTYQSTNWVEQQVQSLKKPVAITEDTVIVDTRSRFEFGSSRFPRSVNVIWSDFAKSNSQPGVLDDNLNRLSNRLSMLGLSPEKPVVVVGQGLEGEGQAGRVAWMLLYLGFKDVQTSTVDALPIRRAGSGDEIPVANVANWDARVDETLLVQTEELKKSLMGKRREAFHLIDVRSPKEYFARDNKTEQYVLPDLQALNIEWKDFFTKDGRPNLAIRKQLESINVKPNSRIVVISDQGLRSGAATYALKMMGYSNVGNYAAGWNYLKSGRKPSRKSAKKR